MARDKTSWSLRRVSRESGRSPQHVSLMCRLGLLPDELLPGGQKARLPEDVAAALVLVFGARLVTEDLASAVKHDPKHVVEVAEALASLARLAMTPAMTAGSEAA